jgi:hypothetical protein
MSDADKLLAAYVDGVAELDGDERKRVEALLDRDATARADEAATRELLGQLREMPPIGVEPSWTDLEAAIAREVGDAPPRKPWWRTWRWVIPTAALAATAVIAILLVHRSDQPVPSLTHNDTPIKHVDVPAPPAQVLWIDEQAIDLDSVNADELFGELDDDLPSDDALADDSAATGLLPAADLGWIDNLDDKSLERAETFLEHKKKS